jgi:hypothetical protein
VNLLPVLHGRLIVAVPSSRSIDRFHDTTHRHHQAISALVVVQFAHPFDSAAVLLRVFSMPRDRKRVLELVNCCGVALAAVNGCKPAAENRVK